MKNLAVLFVLLSCLCYAQVVEMPAIFSDNMVLQQRSDVPFWGKAVPSSKIVLKATWGATASAEVPADGFWNTKLKTPKAGGPYEVILQIGDTAITYKNVLIGEVWICKSRISHKIIY